MATEFQTNGIARDPLDGLIDFTAAGSETQELVAAPSVRQAIKVIQYVFTCPADAGIIWKSGTTKKSGTMTLQQGISVPSPGPGGRQFQCAAGEALNMTVDTPGVYGGHFIYQIVEVS